MKELTVEELLLNISEKASNKHQADEAFTELYYRYSKFLTSAVQTHMRSQGKYIKEIVDMVVSNVFIEVYHNPLNFSFDPQKHASEIMAFKGWIVRIARNEFYDIIKQSSQRENRLRLVGDEDLLNPPVEIEVEEEFICNNRKLLDKALEGLNDEERYVLMSCYDVYEEGRYTPSDVLDILCEKLSTTRANIRQIKKRSLDKVKNYLNSASIKSKS